MAAGDSGRTVFDDLLYYGLVALFYAAPRFLYQVEVYGAQNFRHRPSTMIVANHKRDLDSVILPPTLLFNGVRPRRPLYFAGREDMFWRGFLASFDVVPSWLRRLLYKIDLTAVMRALRVLPMRRFPERTMEEALREILQFTTRVREAAVEMRAGGMRVDPELLANPEERIGGWVQFATRRRLVIRHGIDLHVDPDRLAAFPATHWGNPVRYCVNEVQSVRAALGH